MRRAVAGQARAHRPCTNIVARIPVSSSVSKIRSVASTDVAPSGCSTSKVRATRNGPSGRRAGEAKLPPALLLDAGDHDPADEEALEDQKEQDGNHECHQRPGLDEAR